LKSPVFEGSGRAMGMEGCFSSADGRAQPADNQLYVSYKSHLSINCAARCFRRSVSESSLSPVQLLYQPRSCSGRTRCPDEAGNRSRQRFATGSSLNTSPKDPKIPPRTTFNFTLQKFSYKPIDTTGRAQTPTPQKKSTEKISLTTAQSNLLRIVL
jgi:hypothetical protein